MVRPDDRIPVSNRTSTHETNVGGPDVETIIHFANSHVSLLNSLSVSALDQRVKTLDKLQNEIDFLANTGESPNDAVPIEKQVTLNRLLWLSRLCPYEDVRVRCGEFADKLRKSIKNSNQNDSTRNGGTTIIGDSKFSATETISKTSNDTTVYDTTVYDTTASMFLQNDKDKKPNEHIGNSCGSTSMVVKIPNSSFWTSDDLPEINYSLIEWTDSFTYGYLSQMHYVLSAHQPFLEYYSNTMKCLLFELGPLPKPWRHFLGMMGASRHRCEYLVRKESELFLLTGGDSSWIADPKNAVPKKLQNIQKINAIIAHQPWLLTGKHLKALLNPPDGRDRWNASELLFALTILATFHSLCSFVYALGLELEDPIGNNDTWVDEHIVSPSGSDDERNVRQDQTANGVPNGQQNGITNPAQLKQNGSGRKLNYSLLAKEKLPCCFIQDRVSRAYMLSQQEAEELNESRPEEWAATARLGDTQLTVEQKHALHEVMSARPRIYAVMSDRIREIGCDSDDLDDPSPDSYADFGQKKPSEVSQNSWGDHAYTLLAQFCPDIATGIHDEFEYVSSYSNNSVGGQQVQTTLPLRRSMLVYVFRLYGLVLDDFNYSRLNFYMTLLHKVFLKKLVCYPEHLLRIDYIRVLSFDSFNLQDMIHYVNLACQVRRIVELQYVMAAFEQAQRD